MSAPERPSIRRVVDLNEEQREYVMAIDRIVGLRKLPSNISKVLEHLYLGSEDDALDISSLKRLGITHIVNTVDPVLPSTRAKKFYQDKFEYLGFNSKDMS